MRLPQLDKRSWLLLGGLRLGGDAHVCRDARRDLDQGASRQEGQKRTSGGSSGNAVTAQGRTEPWMPTERYWNAATYERHTAT